MLDGQSSELIKQGAEAKIFKTVYLGRTCVVKERFVKRYRHPDLDDYLTKERIKAECRAIVRCKLAGVRTPALYSVDLVRRYIFMEYIQGATTLEHYLATTYQNIPLLEEQIDKSLKEIVSEVGSAIGKMHDKNIIHGDLTTSNIMIARDSNLLNFKLIFIDFGLSLVEASAEDKGVDLYVLERALLSSHKSAKALFEAILESYSQVCKRSSDVLCKLNEIRARGRKRLMVG